MRSNLQGQLPVIRNQLHIADPIRMYRRASTGAFLIFSKSYETENNTFLLVLIIISKYVSILVKKKA